MIKLNYLFHLLMLVAVFGACAKLDPMVFRGEEIEAYLLENYEGESDMDDIPSSFNIPEDHLHLFTLNSQLDTEASSTEIYALYIGDLNTIATDTIIVYSHGQSKHMDAYWPRTKLLANIGGKNNYGVLTYDYRGYGLSKGSSTEATLYEDTRTVLRWLKAQGVTANHVVFYGFSLGSVPATEMAANFEEFKPSKLILEAPMASAANLAEEATVMNVSAEFFSTLEFDNAEKIKQVQQPFYLFHGELDDYLKISNGEIIYQNYSGVYGHFERVPNANHGTNGVPQNLGYQNYIEQLESFIKL
ncbi:MAG: alpha/beta hydrolase [Flavobacteriales bacterium]|jgi:pimeloyl-ACP methyl ester carboxylesterase|nr:alpha/beta hydrolase [Flavobacteriales bacterium]